ncbi:MAG: tRNA pseudouridine(38-40) synthase TruA [Bacteroidota bacterium]|nr:tRNA pseudouridine(38-40) synthase TruA [Bacteroidota bacterium]
MSRFKLYIEYDGTRYSGWQIQKNAQTVQGAILDAAYKVFQIQDLEVYGSGRTDAGVHALQQIAHLEVRTMLAPEIIRVRLNDELPGDINIIEVEKAAKNFHARHDAVARSYLYQITRRRTAFGKRYVWWLKEKFDFQKMQEASKLFVGMKNLQSFTADDPEEKSTKVLIEEIEMKEAGDLILIRIYGSHFLWKLVRQIVGVIVEVGSGKLALDKVQHYIKIKSNEPAKFSAPPSGLFLERVYYQGDQKLQKLEPVLSVVTSPHKNL